MNRLALGLGLFVLYGIDEAAGMFKVSVRAGEGDGAAELYAAETDDEATVDAMIAAVVAIRDDATAAAAVTPERGEITAPETVREVALPSFYDLLPGKPRPMIRWRESGIRAVYGRGGPLATRVIETAFRVLIAGSENVGKPGSIFSAGEVKNNDGEVTLVLSYRAPMPKGDERDAFVQRVNSAVQDDLDIVGFGRVSRAVFAAPPAFSVAMEYESEKDVVGSDNRRSARYFMEESDAGMVFYEGGVTAAPRVLSRELLERLRYDLALEAKGTQANHWIQDELVASRADRTMSVWGTRGAKKESVPVSFSSADANGFVKVDVDASPRAVAPAAAQPAPATKAAPMYPDLFTEIAGKNPPEDRFFVFVRQSGEALLVFKVERFPPDIIVANGTRRGEKIVSAFDTAYPDFPPPASYDTPPQVDALVHRADNLPDETVKAFLGDENARGYGAVAKQVAIASSIARGKFLPFAAKQVNGVQTRRSFVIWLVAPADLPAGVDLDEGVADFIRRNYKEEHLFRTVSIVRAHADGSISVQSVDRLHARLTAGSQWAGAPGSARTVGATILPLIAKELGRKGYPYAVDKLTRHRLSDEESSAEFVLFNAAVGVRRDLIPSSVLDNTVQAFDSGVNYNEDKGKPLNERPFGVSIAKILSPLTDPIHAACVVSLFVGKGKGSIVVLRVSHGASEESFVAVDATLVAWTAAMAGGAQRLTAQVIREQKNKHVLLRYWRDDAQTDLVAIAYLVLQPFPGEFKADEAASCLSYQLSPLGVEKIKAEAKSVASSGLSIEIGDIANYDRRVLVDGKEPAFSTLKTEIAPFVRELMALSRASGDVKAKKGMDSPVLFISAGYSFAVLTSVVFSGSGHVGARRVIRVDRGTPGTVAVSLHAFAELLGNDTAKALSFTTARSDAGAVLRMVGSRSGEIDAKPASVTDGELRDRYASKMEPVCSLEWDDAEVIEAVSSTMSSDDTRPHLACVSIGAGSKAVDAAAHGKLFPAGRMYFHATDGHRMTLGWSALKVSPPRRFDLCVGAHAVPLFLQLVEQGRISGRSAEVFGSAVPMGLELEYGITRETDDKHWTPELWIVRHGEDFVWGQSGLQPPAWYQVIPDDSSLVGSYEFSSWKEAVKAIDAADATYTDGSAMNRGMLFTPGEGGKATVKAVSGIEGARTKKSPLVSEDGTLVLPDLRSKGEPMPVEIQSSYLRDAIAAVGKGGRVSMRVSGQLDPALFTSGRDGGRIAAVVMPRRIKAGG